MNTELAKKVVDAARNVLDFNLRNAHAIHGMKTLQESLMVFDVDAMGKAASKHPVASEQTDDVLAAANASFQQRVQPWLLECFGPVIAADTRERNHRFFEESTELVQACGMTASEAHQLIDYVYGRPIGEKQQETGGVMVTLAALCLAQGLDMHAAGERELARISVPETVLKIRAKQAAKPKHSPLPEAATAAETAGSPA